MLLLVCLCCLRLIRNWLVWVDRWCSLFSFVLNFLVMMLLLLSLSGGVGVIVEVSRCVYLLCEFSVLCSVIRCGEFSGVSIVCILGSRFRLLCRVEKLCGCVECSVMCVRMCLRLFSVWNVLWILLLVL